MIELYPHQKEVLNRLHNGCILWAETGVGKSITALAYFLKAECDRNGKPRDLLIITTARKRDTLEWESDCIKAGINCYGKGVKVTVDSWNNIQKYRDVQDRFIIFDEQRVTGKGPWANSFLRMAKRNRWILLSATPGDKWIEYETVFVANGFYRSRGEFRREHCIYSPFITKYPKLIGYRNENRLFENRSRILVGMHFDKSTVQHHENVNVEYDRDLYDYILKERFDPFREQPVRDAAGLCYLLRRTVNDDKRRIAEVKGIMRRHPKVIIFYNFDYELELLRDLSCHTSEWNGHHHDPVPDGTRWAYLVQYTAGSEGWNCVSTDTIIFFSRSYSYKAMVQAAGRIDRLNTGYHDLYYYYLISDSGIDRAIGRALSEKEDFNESAYYDSLSG